MTRTSPPQVAFSSGEISPLLHQRFDYQRYQTGLAACRGFLPMAEGGVTRAPGTWFRGRSLADAAARLVPFIFAANDAVVLEFTAFRMRVWRYGQLVLAGGVPYELVTPYPAESLPVLRWVQSADVLYLCDGMRPIHRLARYALNNWTVGPQVFDNGPFGLMNLDKDVTIQSSGETGTVTLTASEDLFLPGHAGTLLKMEPQTRSNVPSWEPGGIAQIGNIRSYSGNIYEMITNTRKDKMYGSVPPTHTEGDAWTTESGFVTWRFLGTFTGVLRITSVTDATTAIAEVMPDYRLPRDCVTNPTYRWSLGAWSDIAGYPAAIELYDQRLVAAATPTEPRSVWFSAVGDFANFLDGTEADEAFAYTVAGNGSLNRVINLFAGGAGLHIFALGEEFSSRSESRNQAIGPTSAVFARTSGIGSSPARPIGPQGDPIFISRDRRRVYVSAYSLQNDSLRANEISRPSSHLGAGRFEEIVWQGVPLSTAWLRTGEGDLVSMVYDPAEEILGWAPQPVADGNVESMVVTPAADGSLDVLTMVVQRNINGVDVRMIEEQAVPFGPLAGEIGVDQANHLFAALRFAPEVETSEFSLPHLIGQTVHAWTSEGDAPDLVVSPGGIVTLPWPVEWAVIGLFDDSHMVETLDVTAQAPDGSTLGRNKRLQDRGGVGLHATAQLRCRAVERDFSKPEKELRWVNLVERPAAAAGSSVFSGVSSKAPPSGQATSVAYRFAPVGGAPATLTGTVPFVQEAGR